MDEKHTEHPNISGITQSITDAGMNALLSGAPIEEVKVYNAIGQWLAVLGQGIADENWDIVKGLADGEISSDDAAREFGWL